MCPSTNGKEAQKLSNNSTFMKPQSTAKNSSDSPVERIQDYFFTAMMVA